MDVKMRATISRTNVVLFCILAALIATFTTGYHFGDGNQIGHLPIVMRVLDAEYLTNDFFVNANDVEVGPRYYYARLLALAMSVMPVHAVFLALTIVSKSLLALVTFHVATRLNPRTPLASVFAVALVLCVESFGLGGAAQLAESQLQPAMLARPFALLSLWMALEKRILLSTALAMVAIPVHPLVGLESGAIGLMAHCLHILFPASKPIDGARARARQLVGACVCGFALLGALHLLFGQAMERSLSTYQFIDILCYSRAPHHYLPSTFSFRSYFFTGCFFLAMWVSWYSWKRDTSDRENPRKVLWAILVVVLLLCGGYLFVEVFPSRVFASAQTFRTLFVVKWFGFLLFAGMAARAIGSNNYSASGWLLLIGSGPFQPLIVLIATVFVAVRDRVKASFGAEMLQILFGLTILQSASFAADGNWSELQGVTLLTMLGFLYLSLPNRSVWSWVPVVPVVAVVGALVAGYQVPRVPDPQISLKQLDDPLRNVAAFAMNKTPRDALFIVPPDQNNFRVLASRAVLVQWKAFPFGDPAMAEWYQRMRDCYVQPDIDVKPEITRLPNPDALSQAYHKISDPQLVSIARKYGCNYAILYADTETRLDVLFEDPEYKLVRFD